MAKTIIGLDIGHWSVKLTTFDFQDHSIVGCKEFLHARSRLALLGKPLVAEASSEGVAGEDAQDAPTPPAQPTENEDESGTPESEPAVTAEEEVWMQTLRELVEADEFIDAESICCNIPAGLVTFLQVPVPFDDEDKVATILPSMLGSRLTSDLDKFFWSFYVEKRTDGDDSQPYQARVALVEKEDLRHFISQLQSVGVDPTHLVFGPLAIAEAFHATEIFNNLAETHFLSVNSTLGGIDETADHSNSVAFLSFGYDTTCLTVIDQRNASASVATARPILFGVHNLAAAAAKNLGATTEEVIHQLVDFRGFAPPPQSGELPSESEFYAQERQRILAQALQKGMRPLVRDIRRSLQALYAQAKVTVSTIYLYGGGSRIAGIVAELTDQLGVDVVLLPAAKIDPLLTDARQNLLSWSLAMTGANSSIRHRTCDFRHGQFVFRGRSSYLRKQVAIGIAALVIFILLCFGILYTKKASMIAQRDAMKRELTVQTKTLFGAPILTKRKIQSLLEGNGQAAEKKLIPTKSAFELAYDVVSHIPPDLDMSLTRFEVDTRRSIIQMRGDTTDAPAVDKLVSSLEQISCLKEIKKERLTVRDSRADFELHINTEGCI